MPTMKSFVFTLLLAWSSLCGSPLEATEPIRVATFNLDATPPLGSPVAYAPAREILDPLSARGVVLLAADQKPIVLCAVDWLGIANGGYEAWREQLAIAAGTTVQRVAVQTIHQHDTPRCDFTTAAILDTYGEGQPRYDLAFCRDVLSRTADAIEAAIPRARPITHYGIGQAKVEKVASNRRILGDDGKVAIVRYSRATAPAAIAAPEGLIDPYLKCLSFWNDDEPIALLTYYATHPQSYYGQGDVTSEFVGIARAARERSLPGPLHVHFNGAGGNVAAGKYNDGSKANRSVLASRMEAGMKSAWEATEKHPVTADDLHFRSVSVTLPLGDHLREDLLIKTLNDPQAKFAERITAAKHLAWLRRTNAGYGIDLCCVRIGKANVLNMPGELFVEYQLAAQKMANDAFVCMAAYGEYGPGYICTDIAYSQGGYEASERASRVGVGSEKVLMDAMRALLVPQDELAMNIEELREVFSRKLPLPVEFFPVGEHQGFVLLPKPNKRQVPQPWVMYAPTLIPRYPDDNERWMHEQFLNAGIAVAGVDVGEAYGSPKGRAGLDALYDHVTNRKSFAKKPVLFGRSRGGLWMLSWAGAYPERVAGLIGIYPAYDLRTYPGLKRAAPAYELMPEELQRQLETHNPIEQAKRLADAKVPVRIIHGETDMVVPIEPNSRELQRRYAAAGAENLIEVISIPDQGHNLWKGFFTNQKLVDFAIERAKAPVEP